MNKEEFQQRLRGAVLLAPLTKGGTPPFRRLCRSFGADITVSEMAYARKLIKGDRKERALLRRHESEEIYGVQIAARKAEEALEAGKIVEESGADFLDINCGCPIHDTTRRGMGASLLQRPRLIARMLDALVPNLSIPITIKIRTGWKSDQRNGDEVARLAEEHGAAAVCIHGRTRNQRYTKSADWDFISSIAEERSIPVIGNGDIVTPFEAEEHFEKTSVSALMLARGALIKPWLFEEIRKREALLLSSQGRLGVYFTFARFLLEYFGDDELGRKRIMNFLPWHFSLFCRYEGLTRVDFESYTDGPLIHRRRVDEPESDPLGHILGSEDETTHRIISEELLSSETVEEAEAKLLAQRAELSLKVSDQEANYQREEKIALG